MIRTLCDRCGKRLWQSTGILSRPPESHPTWSIQVEWDEPKGARALMNVTLCLDCADEVKPTLVRLLEGKFKETDEPGRDRE